MTPTTFREDRLLRLAEIEESHFWFTGRWALVKRLLRRWRLPLDGPVLDSGCGTGRTLRRLAALAPGERIGLDGRPEGVALGRDLVAGALFLQGDATRLPFRDETFSLVMMLDVLEHIDDRAALREVRRVLRPGGALVLTVPALPALWSYRDEDAGHRRRYTRRLLRERVAGAGLTVVETRYYQFLLFPLVLASRLLGRLTPATRELEELPHPLVNRLFAAINRLEVRLGDAVPWPWGSSLAAVCRR